MRKENLSDIQLHSAGATVRHEAPFEDLTSYVNEKEITQDFRDKWVIPFYFELNNQSDEWISQMIQLKPNITDEIILQNLGDFDWRTRSTGSYFASITGSDHLEDIIGTHLLKSEVCFAGSEYALSLAFFNSPKAGQYFSRYLNHYLNRPDLYFNQGSVITALKYLDEINGSDLHSIHLSAWEACLSWRDRAQIKNLENLKNMVPDKISEIDKQIEEFEPQERSIDTELLRKQIRTLNLIHNG